MDVQRNTEQQESRLEIRKRGNGRSNLEDILLQQLVVGLEVAIVHLGIGHVHV